MSVVSIPPHGEWFGDARSGERALRVSWHTEKGCFILSTWRGSACVGTVRLGAADAARLIAVLGAGLAAASEPQSAEVVGAQVVGAQVVGAAGSA